MAIDFRAAVPEPEPRTLGLAMVGELDMARDTELLKLVVTLDPAPGTAVDVDMSEVTFVDSSGLRGLVAAHDYLDGRGCRLRLMSPRPQLVKVINLVGFDEILTVVAPPDEAPSVAPEN